MKYLLLVLLFFCNGYPIIVSSMMEGETITDFAEIVVGENVSISNVDAQYDYRSMCTYKDAFVISGNESLLFDGIVLSSGSALALNNNNNVSDHTTLQIGLSPDSDLQKLLPKILYVQTYDATFIEFDFIPEVTGTMYFNYIFGSDEYFYPHDPLYERYTDVMGIFVNGENIAVLPGTTPVSVKTVNEYYNSEYFNDNNHDHPIFATEMDGFTDPLIADYDVTAGEKYHMKLGITDANDFSYDSWVLFGKGSLRVEQEPIKVSEESLRSLIIFILIVIIIVLIVKA